MNVEIRDERAEDAQAIRRVTNAAFKLNSHASGTEAAIIEALREANALTVSLVATMDNEVVGHVAFSPITIDGRNLSWFGLGPVSVKPELHGHGIGSALIREGLSRLKQAGATGCVLLGDPAFYRRFGFENDPALHYEGAPAQYFMSLYFHDVNPSGKVAFHKGFAAS
jgi:putative acetyltransferase